MAGSANTAITFAFREDPAYFYFSNVTLFDTTISSDNLIANGTFASGSGSYPTGWIESNDYGAIANGVVSRSCGGGFATCWYDGSVQAYDALSQEVGTTIGHTYTLSFDYTDNGGLTTFSDLSTNGDTTTYRGNGIDILAYAQDGLPAACPAGTICAGAGSTAVPEPVSLTLLAGGLVAFGVSRRRRA